MTVTFFEIAASVKKHGHHTRMASCGGQMHRRSAAGKKGGASSVSFGRQSNVEVGIGIGSAIQKQLRRLNIIGFRCEMERGFSICIANIRIQSPVQQEFDYFRLAGPSRPVQRGSLVFIIDINLHSCRQQHLNHPRRSQTRGFVQGRQMIFIACIRRGAVSEKQCCDFLGSRLGGRMQRGAITGIPRIWFRAVSQEQLGQGRKSRSRGLMQNCPARVVAGMGSDASFQRLPHPRFVIGAYGGYQGGFFPSLGLHARTGSGRGLAGSFLDQTRIRRVQRMQAGNRRAEAKNLQALASTRLYEPLLGYSSQIAVLHLPGCKLGGLCDSRAHKWLQGWSTGSIDGPDFSPKMVGARGERGNRQPATILAALDNDRRFRRKRGDRGGN